MSSTSPSELDALLEVVRHLNGLAIPYMLTGSLAKTFYATPRMTRDIDLVIELSTADVERLVKTFSENFYIDGEMVSEAVSSGGMFNLIHNASHVKVDLIVRKNDRYRITELSRRRPFTIKGTAIWVVAPEDLVLSKLFWAKDSHSEMQLNDIRDLLQSVVTLDRQYMEPWLDYLGVRDLFERVLK